MSCAIGDYMTTVYRSKIDVWLIAVLGITIVASLFASFAILSSETPVAFAIATFTAIIGIELPLWLLLSTHYTLGDDRLTVQSGPFKWRIPVADITDITQSSNPISSPALSLDRLRIDYSRGSSLMISPHNKSEFLRDIEAARRNAT